MPIAPVQPKFRRIATSEMVSARNETDVVMAVSMQAAPTWVCASRSACHGVAPASRWCRQA